MKPSALLIQPAAPEPIYRQITEQIKRFVASGQLAPGDILPSVRDMAGFHAINPMTVSRAYSLLEEHGVVERLRGKGMAVAASTAPPRSAEQRLDLLDPQLRDLSRQAEELELPASAVLQRLARLMEK